MKMRILLIGKTGQVGTELAALLAPSADLVALGRRELDLSKPSLIRQTVRDIQPQVILNAAAYTDVNRAESEQSIAQSINADAPAVLAGEAKRIGAMLVHYSTDYVFDGKKNSPYEEDDIPNPLNVYGATKLAGERAIQEVGISHLIFRTSWVYGTRGRNFMLTMLRLAKERDELKVVGDQIGAPTWSREIAAATIRIVLELTSQGQKAFSTSSGLYHLTAGGQTSWHDFANAIFEEASGTTSQPPWLAALTGGSGVVPPRIVPISTAEFPTPAERPAYSVLSNRRITQTLGIELAHWRAQLRSAFAATPVRDGL
jgi:dTDP-4-dehydrorhamnose reductase